MFTQKIFQFISWNSDTLSEVSKLFCNRPESKYFRLYKPHGLYISPAQLCCQSTKASLTICKHSLLAVFQSNFIFKSWICPMGHSEFQWATVSQPLPQIIKPGKTILSEERLSIQELKNRLSKWHYLLILKECTSNAQHIELPNELRNLLL